MAFDLDGGHLSRHARGRRGEHVHLVAASSIGFWYCIALEIVVVVVVLETVYGPLYTTSVNYVLNSKRRSQFCVGEVHSAPLPPRPARSASGGPPSGNRDA